MRGNIWEGGGGQGGRATATARRQLSTAGEDAASPRAPLGQPCTWFELGAAPARMPPTRRLPACVRTAGEGLLGLLGHCWGTARAAGALLCLTCAVQLRGAAMPHMCCTADCLGPSGWVVQAARGRLGWCGLLRRGLNREGLSGQFAALPGCLHRLPATAGTYPYRCLMFGHRLILVELL